MVNSPVKVFILDNFNLSMRQKFRNNRRSNWVLNNYIEISAELERFNWSIFDRII